jgi:sigma-B regulation protein RsbU (phosphoserine phosphatase)
MKNGIYENTNRKLKKKITDLKTLLELTRLLSSDMSLDDILETMFEATRKIMNSDRYSLFIYDEEKDELYSRIARKSEIKEIRFPADKGIAGSVFKTGKLVNIKDCYSDKRFNPEIDTKTGYKTKTLLCVPMKSFDGKIVGVIQVLNKKQNVFDEYDEYLLQLLASHAGVAIQRAFLIEHYIEKQKLESEMNIANKIQASLTPDKAPLFKGFDISCFSRQCESTGGDYLDFVVLPEGRLVVVIGDVTGHGLGASLLMLVARSTFRVIVKNSGGMTDLTAVMNNRIIQDFHQERIMTFFYSVLDNRDKKLKFVNCGHDEPLWYHAKNETIDHLKQSGLPLGMLPETEYKEGEILNLEKDDILLLYTDGITEAINNKKEMYGVKRLENVIIENARKKAVDILKCVKKSIFTFISDADQLDDMTMIVIKVKGK